MSIILKGIDIPEKENRMYMMELYADGHCSVAKIEDGECYELTIPSETEAIQIPTPHGRLIDADNIDYDEFWHRDGQGFTIAVCQGAQRIIEEQPTILEAED